MADPGQRTALVTGASGAIGWRLCLRLSEAGWRVIGLSARSAGEGPWQRYVACDLAAPGAGAVAAKELAAERIEVVWHLAAKAHALAELHADGREYERINVGGTRAAVALAREIGARRIVLASSIKAMGEGGAEVLDESAPCAPATPYGQSKLEAERVVLAARGAIEPVVLRFCMVYGARGHGNMGRMLEAVECGRFPPFPETGNRRSFVFVEDAVQACVLAGVAKSAAGEVFLVTDGRQYSTRELFLAMRATLGRAAPRLTPPLGMFRAAARIGDFCESLLRRRVPLDSETLAKLTDSSAYSSAKMIRTLGYAPAWPLARGLAEMVKRDR
ncbi:MAG: NAD-dependent epimerase/dehydratase family protein [Opitutaceae bacterium]|nr:NAD-dependent epimerase/dehydratase family protein [Opitutaceae bacterium]